MAKVKPLSDSEKWVAEEKARCAPMLNAFIEAYGVKPYEPLYMNYQKLLKQGGAGNQAVKQCLRSKFKAANGQILDACGDGAPFDHLEIYGRDRVPLFMVGHPYNVDASVETPCISQDAAETLAAIRELGLSVLVLDKSYSWYGFKTAQVAVYHWPTVKAVCGDCPMFPLPVV